ncbi:MAG: PH domain-containing protein [bacterium]|jgi:hypothetical protein
MGLFDMLLGNASEIDTQRLEEEFSTILVDGERIEHASRLVRDLIVFTDKRIVLVDKQGLTGKKRTWLSIPYKMITKFSKESAGTFDMDSEIKIWLRGEAEPLNVEFGRNKAIDDIYRVLSACVLK